MQHKLYDFIRSICTGYTYSILILGVVLSPPPYSILSAALLALNTYATLKPRLRIAATLFTIILTPMAFETVLPFQTAGLTSTPTLLLLIFLLKENPLGEFKHSTGRSLTARAKTMMSASIASAIIASILNHPSVTLSSTLTLTCMLSLAAYLAFRIPKEPFKTSKQILRTLVGEEAGATVRLDSNVKIPVDVQALPEYDWIRIEPKAFTIKPKGDFELKLTVKPPLACPDRVNVKLTAVDPWGLTYTCQTLEALELHAIPRARYAEWLAKRYLEGSMRGPGYTIIPQLGLKPSRAGVEFHGCRLYTPGDNPRNIEWKHTCKLQSLIVKEYGGGFGRSSLVAGNMTVESREEADETLYNLISSTYTLARDGSPIALALYTRRSVILALPPSNPEEALKTLLKTVGSVEVSESTLRVLSPPQIDRINRLIEVLKRSKAADGVLKLLQFEYEALLNTAKRHPASKALRESSARTPTPALLILVSNWSHDAEALSVKIKELKERGFEVIQLSRKP